MQQCGCLKVGTWYALHLVNHVVDRWTLCEDAMMTVRLQLEVAMARAVVSKNKFRQIVALNFQENHASQDIQRSMHNDDHEILFVRDCLHHSVLRA